MSSDLDQVLREAREALPGPDEQATQRARKGAVAAIRRSRPRTRVLLLAGAAIMSAIALGVTAGSLNAPSVTAASQPSALGFVPEPGWFALQSPPPAVVGMPIVAVASNVPIEPNDAVYGLVEPSGLPYSTLLDLPPRGTVIVASMTSPAIYLGPISADPTYPATKLPLRLRNATPYVQWGAQVRPDQPLAAYQLRAEVEGMNIDVTVYFGTATPSSAMRAAAARQLAGLVIRSVSRPQHAVRAALTAAPLAVIDRTSAAAGPRASKIVDRTMSCSVGLIGGIYKIEVSANTGLRVPGKPSVWKYLPSASARSSNGPGQAWLAAGNPIAPLLGGYRPSPNRLSISAPPVCIAAPRIPLSGAGLSRSSVGALPANPGEGVACFPGARFVVRVRAIFSTPTSLHEHRDQSGTYLSAAGTVVRGYIAVRSKRGMPLAYADVREDGKARLFTASSCTPD